MATNTMNVRVLGKRDTLANWTNNNPVLLSGEVVQVIMTDGTLRHKTGNGTSTFSQLPYDDEIAVMPKWFSDAYDTDKDGIVDNAEKLGGQLPSYYAKASDISPAIYNGPSTLTVNPNGTTDGVNTFTSAADAAAVLNNKTLPQPVTIDMQGNCEADGKRVELKNINGIVKIAGNNYSVKSLWVDRVSNITISNLKVHGGMTASVINYCASALIDTCEITTTSITALWVMSSNSTIKSTTIGGANGSDAGGLTFIASENSTVAAIDCTLNGGYGINASYVAFDNLTQTNTSDNSADTGAIVTNNNSLIFPVIITSGTEELTPGTSSLADGVVYLQYE